ncbi:MAG TPA: DUF2156 domain-containing protein [Gemmatimonadales bacterium]|nr:DUF2156 domain-containing protein [Gemmatimonadales bacterium]
MPHPTDPILARELVLRHGWNATAYQILNPGIAHWFSAERDAVVGYVTRAGVRVVAGAPVASGTRLGDVAREFEADAKREGETVCYFCAEARLEGILARDPSHDFVLLGAQPAWDPAAWVAATASHASLRAQFSRARRKGITVREEQPSRAENDPSLAACLERWLATRGLPPLHFLIEPDTLSSLRDRRIFVARRGDASVGFVVASVIPARAGWLIEQFVRAPEAPNGTMELLLDTAVRALARDGARYVSLGLAPLATGRVPSPASAAPVWLRALFGWMRAHGRRFFNFGGLEAFKAKFSPDRWEPVYAIYNGPRVTPRVVYAIAAAFTGGSPVSTFARGLGWAVRRELTGSV